MTCLIFRLAGTQSSRPECPGPGPGWRSAGLRSSLSDTSECWSSVSLPTLMVVVCTAGTSSPRGGLWCRPHLGTKRRPLPQACWEGPSRSLQAGSRQTRLFCTAAGQKVFPAAEWVRRTFQSAGVATRLPAVIWSESTTRKISSKLRPVVAG